MPNNKRLFLKYYIENIQNMLYIDSFFLKLINQLLLFQVWFIFLKVHHKPPEPRVKSQKPQAANVVYKYVLFYLTGDKTRRVKHSMIELVDARAEVLPADYHPLATHQQKCHMSSEATYQSFICSC